MEQVAGDGSVLYYLQDQLGSTRGLTDNSGALVGTFSYDAYGNLTGSTGTATTPFGYAGQYTDSESGLQYLRARFYDPQTAQFLSVDPLVGLTQQPYAYVGGDPLNLGDPSGLCKTPFGGVPFGSSNDCSDDVGATLHNTEAAIYVLPPSQIPAVARPGTINYELTHPQLPDEHAQPEYLNNFDAVVIGKMAKLLEPCAVHPGETTLLPLLRPDLGSPKANWQRNAGVLRLVLRLRMPVRDSSVDSEGNRVDNTGFIRAERYLIEDRGLTYDRSTTTYGYDQFDE
jgi:RHS repeat-associated protein